MTIIGIPGWVPTEATQPKMRAKAHPSCDPSLQVQLQKQGKGAMHPHTSRFTSGLRHMCAAGMACLLILATK